MEIGKKHEIINSPIGNSGKIVIVTGYAGKKLDGITQKYGDRWYIDQSLKTNKGFFIDHVGEKQLKPIYDGNEKVSWESMKDIWQPDTIKEQPCTY